jgi:TM2 domain-containing membrane protein YozV
MLSVMRVLVAVLCFHARVALASRPQKQSVDNNNTSACLLQKAASSPVKTLDPEFLETGSERTATLAHVRTNASTVIPIDANSSVVASPKFTFVTLVEQLRNEIEFEVSGREGQVPEKNKLVVVLLQLFALPAFCGVDRCYMGQPCIGALKALTFAGFGVWAFIDQVIVLVNSLKMEPSINTVGFVANWEPTSIEPAYYLAWVQLVMMLCSCCCYCGAGGAFGTKLVQTA